jgi:hypothetical protein
MPFELIIAAVSGVYVVAMYVLRRRRDLPGQHPYRDPYGDTPEAWRSATSARDPPEAIRRAPGTR